MNRLYRTSINNKYQSHSNRGMVLENDLNATNEYYLLNNVAVIYKKPTPITINKVDYPSRKDAVIKEAHFKIPSTTDYNGIYKGKYIDFEAKETKLDYFPLANINAHQIKHLKKIMEHGGIGFLIVRFSKKDEIFYLDGTKFFEFLETISIKSIPIEYFYENGYKIKVKFNPRIDYLKIVDEIYFKGEVLWKSSEVIKKTQQY